MVASARLNIARGEEGPHAVQAARPVFDPVPAASSSPRSQPNFYRDVDGKNGDAFVACCYVNTWNSFALKLSCRNGSASCIDNQLAGPVWGHVNMSPSTLNWFLT
jgi:hypothetical protein